MGLDPVDKYLSPAELKDTEEIVLTFQILLATTSFSFTFTIVKTQNGRETKGATLGIPV